MICQKEHKFFQAAHELRHSLSSLHHTASGSLVFTKGWEPTESVHRELFLGLLKKVLQNEPDENEQIRDETKLRET